MRKLSGFVLTAAFGLGLAGGAGAEPLRWEGTLTLDFVEPGLPAMSVAGGGVATVNGSAGLGPLSVLRLAGGITGTDFVWVTDPHAAPLNQLRATVALGTGALGPISGGGTSPLTQGALPLVGELRLCVLLPPSCPSYIPVPLTVGGTRGAGIGGGSITVNTYGPGIGLSVTGAPWTIGVATAFTGTTVNGAPTASSTRSGFAHGPASGTTSTANLGGVVQLVTPIQFRTSLGVGPPAGIFGALKIAFVPEPSTALLLGAGVAGLALVGRKVKRRRCSESDRGRDHA